MFDYQVLIVVCDGCRGLSLGFTTLCSLLSISYLLLKAVSMYMATSSPAWRPRLSAERKDMVAIDALFLSSFALAVAHVVVAYRGSWRERRKLLVFRIDVEAKSVRAHKALKLKLEEKGERERGAGQSERRRNLDGAVEDAAEADAILEDAVDPGNGVVRLR
ncbi:hypothetical protein BHM03_00013279 [Ensete ventricosum]|uniref:Uncharacterized protein n=1 Tax=Ensete ventricosum TaxID=4639 RepID=A0A445MDU6_ENSVE|nr:hypothetical protein BHM03_00013279 [Ensete ventricosum]